MEKTARKEVSQSRPLLARPFAVFAIVFGALTLFSGGSVLFVDGQARLDAGQYVPFVLWFNFFAGFAYILAGVGLYLWRGWVSPLSALIALATLLVSAGFAFHVWQGGGYEMRTVGAMILRSVVWVIIAFYVRAAWRRISHARS